MTKREPLYPIIYVRGYAMTASEGYRFDLDGAREN